MTDNYWDETPQHDQEEGASYWDQPQLSAEEESPKDVAEPEVEAINDGWADEVARREAIVADILSCRRVQETVSPFDIEAHLLKDSARCNAEAEEERRVIVDNQEPSEKIGYWDWDGGNDVLIKEDIFSVSHIESLLLRSFQDAPIAAETHDHIAYETYWNWPTLSSEERKQEIIRCILEEEHIRQTLSASHLEKLIKKDAARVSSCIIVNGYPAPDDYWTWMRAQDEGLIHAPHLGDPTHPNHVYWDWSPSITSEQKKIRIICDILKDEDARMAVSATHKEDCLKADSWRRTKNESDLRCHLGKIIDTEYWTWNTDFINESHVEDLTHPANAYWDWEPLNFPMDGTEIKRDLIVKILEEETVRQWFITQHSEEKLKVNSFRSMETNIVAKPANTDASYWDMS